LTQRAAQQEVDLRLDVAFAALKFLNEKYRHILEQLNDTVRAEDWILILQSEVTKSGRAVTSSTGVLLIP
jgi:hypothetical protein